MNWFNIGPLGPMKNMYFAIVLFIFNEYQSLVWCIYFFMITLPGKPRMLIKITLVHPERKLERWNKRWASYFLAVGEKKPPIFLTDFIFENVLFHLVKILTIQNLSIFCGPSIYLCFRSQSQWILIPIFPQILNFSSKKI